MCIRDRVDDDLLIPDWSLSINQGGIRYFKTSVGTDPVSYTHLDVYKRQSGDHSNIATIGFAIGFVVMMILDVALG